MGTCACITTTYTYDALGQRIAKKVNGVVTRFVWRGGQVAYETNGGGTITRSYTWGSGTDDLVAIHEHQGGGHYYVVQDRLRSVRALVDANGTWRAAWRYGIYGQELYASGEPIALRFRWAGAQFDEETGWYYLRSRYYDPEHGRFLQEDPVGHAGGMDLYAYAAGDPTSARDPSGMGTEPMPENPSPYACLGTIRGCGDTSSDTFFWGGGGGGGGGGGMDWNGDGYDDADEFQDYANAIQRISATAWVLLDYAIRTTDWGAAAQDAMGIYLHRQMGRGLLTAGATGRSPWGTTSMIDGKITLNAEFFTDQRTLDPRYSLAELRQTLAHEFDHHRQWMLFGTDPRPDAEAECFAVSVTGYVSPFYRVSCH